MPEDLKLWEVSSNGRLAEVQKAKLDLEARIEEWIAADISILAFDLLVIGRQVPTAFGKFIDLLCINAAGEIVVVELKRDKTPREVTAQALDYGSWVKDLGSDEIEGIATRYFRNSTLADEFKSRFGDELPEVINEKHKMYVVASEIDDSTERIIRYLSETYGVAINAAKFNFFKMADGREVLARTLTISSADAAKYSDANRGSKRTAPTLADFQSQAEEAGITELYDYMLQAMSPFFGVAPRKSLVTLWARLPDGSSKALLNVIPAKSSKQSGLRYQLYTKALASYAGIDEKTILAALPSAREEHEYYAGAPEDYQGVAGYFTSAESIETFAQLLAQSSAGKERPHSAAALKSWETRRAKAQHAS